MDKDDSDSCHLLQGWAAITAQICLASIAFSSLIYKRIRERPQRPLFVWTLDVLKQIISLTVAHICGLLIAIIASSSTPVHASECAWYAIAYTFDTSLGLLFTILLHRACVLLATTIIDNTPAPFSFITTHTTTTITLVATSIKSCGDYGNEQPITVWAIQATEWTICVILARAICGTIVLLFDWLLVSIADGIDMLFKGHPVLLLYFVMITCPLIMNVAQVIIQDTILKRKDVVVSGSVSAGISGDGYYYGEELKNVVNEENALRLNDVEGIALMNTDHRHHSIGNNV